MTPDAIRAALKGVLDPDIQKDIVSLGYVKDALCEDGRASVRIELGNPVARLNEAVRAEADALLRAIPGITEVAVTMAPVVRSVTAPEHGRPPLPGVKNVIAVGAGKGGVGKSTVAVNLALALVKAGGKVGILDGDIYGPNVPMMLGLQAQLESVGKQIRPAEKYGLQIVSIGFITKDDAPIIWRGPMLHSAIQQFFREVAWTNLDYLIIDMPPGTGDVALSLSQTVQVSGAVVVTTPQQVSLADSRRAVRMYQKLNIPTLGLVENMSHYECTNCHHEADIFGHGGGERLAADMAVPFLGFLPLYQPIRIGSDVGIPLVIAEPNAPATQSFMRLAENVASQITIAAHANALAHKGKIPLIQVR